MAVTPPQVGVRARTSTDSGPVQPLAQVREIPADLPELLPGQTFTARIQESLADNTYRALVVGKHLTLQLPEGAKPGETLELVVVDRTPKVLVARRTESGTSGALAEGESYPYAKISTAGQVIGQLLPAKGEAPLAAPLNRGQPLLPQAPATGAELAPGLEKAVAQSGLFYESHQAQWVAGKRSLESLRAEPQGQLPVAPRPTLPQAQPQVVRSPMLPSPAAELASPLTYEPRPPSAIPEPAGNSQRPIPESASPAATPAALDDRLRPAQAERPASAERTPAAAGPSAQAIPEEVRPLVQQQLDAVATQRLAWHGEVWPGQGMDWTVEQERVGEREAAPDSQELPRWTTSLRLAMPRLGALEATIELSGSALRLHLQAGNDEAAADLRRRMPDLVRALADAGMTLQSADIRREA